MASPHIFISHRERDTDSYNALVTGLNQKNYSHFDFTVPAYDSNDTESIRQIASDLRKQIRACNYFIIFTTQDVASSEWCMKELRIAQTFDKYILGVRPQDYQGGTPPVFVNACDQTMGFDAAAITRKIETHFSSL